MYTDFYRLTDKPFQLSPDARFFFNSHGHKRALSYLLYGLGQGEGFIVITGDVGTGKTTLIAALHGVLEQRRVIYGKVVSTQLGPDDLLRVVAAEFGLPYEEGSKAVLLKAIESFLKGCVDAGRRVVLLVDEAQNLPRKSIEELRMLSNFSYRGKPLLQSFLLGQREFRNVMRSKEFEQLRQRVIAAYHLRPLEQAEIRSYIEHRLKLVGWNNDPIIEDDVYAGIYDFTKGVPRKINVVCDRLLLFGAMEELHVLDKAACQSVFSDMRDEDLADSDEEGFEAVSVETKVERPGHDGRIVRLESSMENLHSSLAAELSVLKEMIIKSTGSTPAVGEVTETQIKTAKKKTTKKKASKRKATRKKATRRRASSSVDKKNKPSKPVEGRGSKNVVEGAAPVELSAGREDPQSNRNVRDTMSSASVEFFDVTGTADVDDPSTWSILNKDSDESEQDVEGDAPGEKNTLSKGRIDPTRTMDALKALERLVKKRAGPH